MRAAIGGTRLKRWLGCLLTVCLLFALLPAAGLAAGLTLEAPYAVNRGALLTISGTSAGTDVILSIKNSSGEILFFDTQKVVEGTYRAAITLPFAWPNGVYRVTAVSDSAEVVKDVAVRSSGSSSDGGSSGGPGGSGGSSGPPSPSSEPAASASENGVTVSVGVQAVDVGGKLTAVVRADQLRQALELLKNGAENGAGQRIIALNVESAGSASGAFVLELPGDVAALLWDSGIDSLVVNTPSGSVAFDAKSMQALRGDAGSALRFGVATVAGESLPEGAKEAVEGRPVVDLTVEVGDGTVSDFGGGTVKAGIPYEIGAQENPNAVVVYYISDSGVPTVVRNGFYDAATGKMSFGVKHFSLYGIGVNPVNFSDVSGWSKEYITYLAARDVVSGIGEQRFAPGQPITRAEMIALLSKMSGDEASGYRSGLYTDVQADDWYAPYIRWGSENGIADGTGGGTFSPDRPITREEMAVMISRYAAHAAYALPKSQEAAAFADRASFSGWAAAAIAELQQAGVIEGVGGNRFNPGGTATREEAAKMIAVLLQGMSR